MKFEATSETNSAMALRDELQRFADEFWLPDHVTSEQAAAIILDAFKRKIAGQMKLLDLKPVSGQ